MSSLHCRGFAACGLVFLGVFGGLDGIHRLFERHAIIDRRFTPGLRHIWMPILYIAVITPFIALFDVIFKCNYFFIIWPVSGSILETYYYALGTPGWRFAYAATVFAVILTIYGLIELCLP